MIIQHCNKDFVNVTSASGQIVKSPLLGDLTLQDINVFILVKDLFAVIGLDVTSSLFNALLKLCTDVLTLEKDHMCVNYLHVNVPLVM